jgi:S1-C subfamily serine protease
MKRFVFTLFLGACAFGGGLSSATLMSRLQSRVAAQPHTTLGPPAGTDLLRLGDRFEEVARKVSPAVVSVDSSKPAPANNANGKSRAIEESGSGVIVRMDQRPGLYVLTANHVVNQAKPEQITVSLADGRAFHPAQVWADPESDVAVLRLVADNLPTAPVGDSERMHVGHWVLAIGSPFGLNQTVTHGIISARERGQVSLGSTIRIKDFLQTDAAINPGSSGGPLVNLDGEVIGINTAIASQNGSFGGVAFSIPSNVVKRIASQLLERGSVARGYLGLQMAATFEPAEALKLGLDRAAGALVETVYADTPAATAGLKANDVILQVDTTPVRNENHLINFISTLPPGQHVRLHVWRERKSVTLEATVGDWAQAQARFKAAAQ